MTAWVARLSLNDKLDGLGLLLALSYVLIAPYTKVEESFNLHAVHDVIFHGILPWNVKKYDHFMFPGVVPRTFIGSLLLGWVTWIVTLPVSIVVHIPKHYYQILARLLLATLNWSGLVFLRRAVCRRFGPQTGPFFTLLTYSQFHLPFWMGRTLPNMFALFPVNVALSYYIDAPVQRYAEAKASFSIFVATFAAVAGIFRAEVGILLLPYLFQIWENRDIRFRRLAIFTCYSGLAALALSGVVDSYFWRWPVLPEVSGLYFNIWQGKSAEWGVSPFYTYFISLVPKVLLGSLPLALIGAWNDLRAQRILWPSFCFIVLMSFLGHKEWRFIIYVVPIANVSAARGISWLLERSCQYRLFVQRLTMVVIAGILVANFSAAVFLTAVSRANYPGGEAVQSIHNTLAHVSQVKLHIGNYAAQTGASLFLHSNAEPHANPNAPRWIYDKTEHLSSALDFGNYSHVITEDPEPFRASSWTEIQSIRGLSGVSLKPPYPRLLLEEKLWAFKHPPT